MEYRVKIVADPHAESPRKDCVLGVFIAWHGRMNCGDVNVSRHAYENADDVREQCVPTDALCCLPVYLYEHSGCEFSTKPFSCGWDSGQVGWIYATPETLKEGFGDAIPPIDKLAEYLAQEIAVYNDWQSGNVWGYIVEKVELCECCGSEKTEEIDSCWGFIGSDDGARDNIKEHVPEEARELVDAAWENRSYE